MIEPTLEEFQALIPEFLTFTETVEGEAFFDALVPVANQFIDQLKWGDVKGKKAVIYLVAHFMKDTGTQPGATGSTGAGGPVTSERVGDLARSYGMVDTKSTSAIVQIFQTTSYGRIYIALSRTVQTTPLVV
jgi:hypothetical protein